MSELVRRKIPLVEKRQSVYGLTLGDRMGPFLRQRAAFSQVEITTGDSEMMANVLERPELDLLMDVVLTVLSGLEKVPSFGSFVLYGQEGDCEAVCNLRADLRDGPAEVLNWNSSPTNSRADVVRAVDAVLRYAELNKYVDSAPTLLAKADLESDGRPKSNIYRDADGKAVLVFNNDLGRFVVSYYDGDSQNALWVLAVVAQVLASLVTGDVVAQESIGRVKDDLPPAVLDNSRRLVEAVEQMFQQETDPMLGEWREWKRKTYP